MIACLDRDLGTSVADGDDDVGIFQTAIDCDTAFESEFVRIVKQFVENRKQCLTVCMDGERIRHIAFNLNLYFIRHIQFHRCSRLSAKCIAAEGCRFRQ